MSNGGFFYVSERETPILKPGAIDFTPVEVPPLHINEGLGEGLQQLGKAGMAFGAAMQASQDQTNRANAMTTYITAMDAAETAGVNSGDWKNAPANFKITAEAAEKAAIAAAGLSGPDQAEFALQLRRISLSSGGRVATAALNR